jgi:hypothetical protein
MKTVTPACLGGGFLVAMIYIAIFLEVSGYANHQQVGKVLSWAFVPACLGLLTTASLWLKRRRPVRQMNGPTVL